MYRIELKQALVLMFWYLFSVFFLFEYYKDRKSKIWSSYTSYDLFSMIYSFILGTSLLISWLVNKGG